MIFVSVDRLLAVSIPVVYMRWRAKYIIFSLTIVFIYNFGMTTAFFYSAYIQPANWTVSSA